MSDFKSNFPIFATHPNLVYLDTAASALKPTAVISAVDCWYTNFGTNVHRALYDVGEEGTKCYENVRTGVAKFLQAEREEIVFTKGTTDGLNKLARMLEPTVKAGDSIVLTRMEHHANIIPWQQLAKRTGAQLKFIELTADYELDLESAQKLIDARTKIVSFTAASNVLGTIAPITKIVALAKKMGAITVVDAAQAVAHAPIDAHKLGCDFLVFSAHKMYGPTGVGVLYGKKELLEKLEPVVFGGDMIKKVSYNDATWADLPYKFEAGTPPIEAVIGLGAALFYLSEIGWEKIRAHEQELMTYFGEKMSQAVSIIGPKIAQHRVPVFSFTIPGAHPHDVTEILNRDHIAIRAGHHCAMPLMEHLGVGGTARVSFGLYTTKSDIDALVVGIEKVKNILCRT
jgi:cysteine desulfurase/selenocysteine lyase